MCLSEFKKGLFICFKSITDNLGVKILKSRGAAVGAASYTDLAMALSDGLNRILSFIIKEPERRQRR